MSVLARSTHPHDCTLNHIQVQMSYSPSNLTSQDKGEGDLTLDETRFSILTAFFELEAPNFVRSVPVGGYLIY